MDKRVRKAFSFIGCALVFCLSYQAVLACQVDEFYLTKKGGLAASTPEELSRAIDYQAKGNQKKLAYMVKDGRVVKLRENIKVRVLERSFEHGMLKIKLSERESPFWVKDGTLKQVTHELHDR
ncbi:MAG TPA: hypothetical protein VF790_06635 [Dissulfurispiraceae bacterium]